MIIGSHAQNYPLRKDKAASPIILSTEELGQERPRSVETYASAKRQSGDALALPIYNILYLIKPLRICEASSKLHCTTLE